MKKQQIINKTIQLLKTTSSTKDLTLSNIASLCDIGKSTIYDYFDNKDQLIYSSIDYLFKSLINEVNELDISCLNLKESFYSLIKLLINKNKENKMIIYNLFLQKNIINESLKEQFKELQKEVVECLEKKFYLILLKMISEQNLDISKINKINVAFYASFIIGNIIMHDLHLLECSEEEFYDNFYELFVKLVK